MDTNKLKRFGITRELYESWSCVVHIINYSLHFSTLLYFPLLKYWVYIDSIERENEIIPNEAKRYIMFLNENNICPCKERQIDYVFCQQEDIWECGFFVSLLCRKIIHMYNTNMSHKVFEMVRNIDQLKTFLKNIHLKRLKKRIMTNFKKFSSPQRNVVTPSSKDAHVQPFALKKPDTSVPRDTYNNMSSSPTFAENKKTKSSSQATENTNEYDQYSFMFTNMSKSFIPSDFETLVSSTQDSITKNPADVRKIVATKLFQLVHGRRKNNKYHVLFAYVEDNIKSSYKLFDKDNGTPTISIDVKKLKKLTLDQVTKLYSFNGYDVKLEQLFRNMAIEWMRANNVDESSDIAGLAVDQKTLLREHLKGFLLQKSFDQLPWGYVVKVCQVVNLDASSTVQHDLVGKKIAAYDIRYVNKLLDKIFGKSGPDSMQQQQKSSSTTTIIASQSTNTEMPDTEKPSKTDKKQKNKKRKNKNEDEAEPAKKKQKISIALPQPPTSATDTANKNSFDQLMNESSTMASQVDHMVVYPKETLFEVLKQHGYEHKPRTPDDPSVIPDNAPIDLSKVEQLPNLIDSGLVSNVFAPVSRSTMLHYGRNASRHILVECNKNNVPHDVETGDINNIINPMMFIMSYTQQILKSVSNILDHAEPIIDKRNFENCLDAILLDSKGNTSVVDFYINSILSFSLALKYSIHCFDSSLVPDELLPEKDIRHESAKISATKIFDSKIAHDKVRQQQILNSLIPTVSNDGTKQPLLPTPFWQVLSLLKDASSLRFWNSYRRIGETYFTIPKSWDSRKLHNIRCAVTGNIIHPGSKATMYFVAVADYDRLRKTVTADGKAIVYTASDRSTVSSTTKDKKTASIDDDGIVDEKLADEVKNNLDSTKPNVNYYCFFVSHYTNTIKNTSNVGYSNLYELSINYPGLDNILFSSNFKQMRSNIALHFGRVYGSATEVSSKKRGRVATPSSEFEPSDTSKKTNFENVRPPHKSDLINLFTLDEERLNESSYYVAYTEVSANIFDKTKSEIVPFTIDNDYLIFRASSLFLLYLYQSLKSTLSPTNTSSIIDNGIAKIFASVMSDNNDKLRHWLASSFMLTKEPPKSHDQLLLVPNEVGLVQIFKNRSFVDLIPMEKFINVPNYNESSFEGQALAMKFIRALFLGPRIVDYYKFQKLLEDMKLMGKFNPMWDSLSQRPSIAPSDMF